MQKQEEELLLSQCRNRDQEAQKRLYESHCAKMMGVCMRYARNREEAQDILQDGFIRVFEKIGSFRSEGSLEGWVRRVIVNVAIRHIQKNTRIYRMVDIDEAGSEMPFELATTDLETDDLLKMVNKLPDGYRVVFNLYAMEGFSHQEIAEKLGISEGTSKSQLARARQHLVRQLKRLGEDEYDVSKKNRIADGTTG